MWHVYTPVSLKEHQTKVKIMQKKYLLNGIQVRYLLNTKEML